ncbi:MAG TPA: hypothetical protein VEY95_08040 [Azospirillaceae bacterium]|nr:hypothetical protein [Azospirillaceae bacterium]
MATFNGGSDNDVHNGTPNADIISGNLGDDTLNGRGGNDRIFGNRGTDTLHGEAGNDFLDSGPPEGNADQMHGGRGNDIYAVNEDVDAVFEAAGAGTDTVDQWKEKRVSESRPLATRAERGDTEQCTVITSTRPRRRGIRSKPFGQRAHRLPLRGIDTGLLER